MMTASKNKLYHYRAADAAGHMIRGSALAASKSALYQQLHEQSYFLISSRAGIGFGNFFTWRNNVKTEELLDFCLHMQYMDQAGVPLLDALKDAQGATDKLSPVLEDMIQQIRGGKMLSEAIAAHSQIFPEIFAQIIYLAEQSGQLAEGFKKLYAHLSWVHQNKRQFAKSLQYPAFVFALIGAVLWLMSSVVVPQMHELIQISGAEVPYSSQILLQINQGLVGWAPRFIGLCLIVFFFLLGLRFLSHHHRVWQDRLMLRLPFIGGLLQKRDLALFLHFFYVCLSSHLDLLDCLDYGKKAVSNKWLQDQISRCAQQVREGMTLSKAMAGVGIFNQSTLRMVQVGEVTGQLVPLLAALEAYQMRDLKRQIEKFLAYLQPVLLGIIGLILIWIILGIFYPMYDQLLVIEG
jgi:type IV pilus assembly protein PilC